MPPEAQRGVVFTLRVQADGSVASEFAKVGARGEQLKESLGNLKLGVDLSQFQANLGRAEQLGKKLGTIKIGVEAPGAESGLRQLEASTERVMRNRIAMTARVQKYEADQQAKLDKIQEQRRAQLEKATEREKKYWESFASFGEKGLEKRQKAEEAAAEKEAARNERIQEKRKKELERSSEQDKKYWESFAEYGKKAQEERERAEERAAEDHERVMRKMSAVDDKMRRVYAEAASGTTEVARGLVEMGLVGETDMEKIKDEILAVQSAMDQIRGVIGVWHALSEGSRLYSERLNLVAEAQKAVKESAGAGIASKAVGGIASAAVGAGRSAAEDFAMSAGANAAGGLAAGAAARTVGGAALGSTVAAFAFSLAVAGVAIKTFTDHLDELDKHVGRGAGGRGEGGRGFWGSIASAYTWLAKVGQQEWTATGHSPIDFDKEYFHAGPFNQAAYSGRMLARFQGQSERERKEREFRNEHVGEQFRRENEQLDRKLEAALGANEALHAINPRATPETQFGSQRELLKEEKRLLDERQELVDKQLLRTVGPQGQVLAGRDQAQAAAEAQEKRILAYKQKELELARQEREISIDAAKKKLELLSAQIEKQQQIAKEARAAADAASQRAEDATITLGKMGAGDIRKMARLKKTLRAGGRLNRKEEEWVEAHGDEEMKDALRRSQYDRGEERRKLADDGVLPGSKHDPGDQALEERLYRAGWGGGPAGAEPHAAPPGQHGHPSKHHKSRLGRMREEHARAQEKEKRAMHDRRQRAEEARASESAKRKQRAEFRKKNPWLEHWRDSEGTAYEDWQLFFRDPEDGLKERNEQREGLGLGPLPDKTRRPRGEFLRPKDTSAIDEQRRKQQEAIEAARRRRAKGPKTREDLGLRPLTPAEQRARERELQIEAEHKREREPPKPAFPPGKPVKPRPLNLFGNEEAHEREQRGRATEQERHGAALEGAREGAVHDANQKNPGATFTLKADNTIDVKLVADSELERKLQAAVAKLLKDQKKVIETMIGEAIERAKDEQKADTDRKIQRKAQQSAASK